MNDYVKLNKKESPDLSILYAIAASTDPKHDQPLITAQVVFQKQAKQSYCGQGSPTVELLRSTSVYDRSGFMVESVPMDKTVPTFVPKHLKPQFTILLVLNNFGGTA